MRSYSVPAPEELRNLQQHLVGGLARVGIRRGHAAHPGCALCSLESSDGAFIEVYPDQSDLEFKFEVFPIGVSRGRTRPDDLNWTNVGFSAPVMVSLLETEEWLDPEIQCKDAIGENPILQNQGIVGSAPPSAVAVCRHIGSVELVGANGRNIFIATAPFPLTLHVSGLAEDKDVQRKHYRVSA